MTVQKNTPPEPNDYRNDFVGLLRALFKRKRLIIFGVLITTILSLVLAMVVPKTYRSEGFFQFSDPTKEKNNPLFSVASQLLESSKLVVLSQLKDLGMLRVLKDLNIELTQPDHFHVMTIQQFKKYSSAFGNYYEFLGFVRRNKLLEDEEFESLKGLINTTGQFSKLILEIYALSRDDLKNVGQTLLQEKNYVVGVELQIDAHQPATAQRFLNALGAFIRYSIFVERFNEYTSLNLNESQILASRYDNYILSNRAVLEQLRQKRDSLQALYKKYPAFAKVDSRQVVDLEDNGERYLSLVTQIIGVESRIIDLERLLDSFGLERKRNLLYREFFSAVKKKLEAKPGSIEKLINSIHTLRAGFFKQPGDPLSQSLSNSLDIDINRFDILFNKTLRFISGPTLPDIPEWPRKSIFLIFGFFLGVLVFVSIALILEFWEKHKAFIRDGK